MKRKKKTDKEQLGEVRFSGKWIKYKPSKKKNQKPNPNWASATRGDNSPLVRDINRPYINHPLISVRSFSIIPAGSFPTGKAMSKMRHKLYWHRSFLARIKVFLAGFTILIHIEPETGKLKYVFGRTKVKVK